MADVEIKKLSGNCGDPVPNCTVISIRNFETLDIDLTTPVGAFPLPECNADQAILVKAEGNTLAINVAWTLTEEATNISSEATPSTKTPAEQMKYLVNCFQPESIQDSYEITIPDSTAPLVKTGTIRKMIFSKDANAPTLYKGRLEFVVGDVVAGEA